MEDADDEPLFADDLEGLSDDDAVPPLPPPMPSLDDVEGEGPSSPQAGLTAGGTSSAPTGNDQPPQKKRKPLLTLTQERIFSEKGIPYLPKEFSKLKFQGKGNEAADLTYLLKQYEHWANRLFPKLTSVDVMDRIESLAKKKEFKSRLKGLRRTWIRGSTSIVDDENDIDMVNDDNSGVGGAIGDGGVIDDGNAVGDGGHSYVNSPSGNSGGSPSRDIQGHVDSDVWTDTRERTLTVGRSLSRDGAYGENKENSSPTNSEIEGGWKLAVDKSSEHNTRSTHSRDSESSWKLAVDNSSEHNTRPTHSRDSESSWKLAVDNSSEHNTRSTHSRDSESSWKLAVDIEDQHTTEAENGPDEASHTGRLDLGSPPHLASATDTIIGVHNNKESSGDQDNPPLSPVLEGRDNSYRNRVPGAGEDSWCTTDARGDVGNSATRMEDHDSDTNSPVQNRRLHNRREQLVWSDDDSEDELKLCIDEDSAKE